MTATAAAGRLVKTGFFSFEVNRTSPSLKMPTQPSQYPRYCPSSGKPSIRQPSQGPRAMTASRRVYIPIAMRTVMFSPSININLPVSGSARISRVPTADPIPPLPANRDHFLLRYESVIAEVERDERLNGPECRRGERKGDVSLQCSKTASRTSRVIRSHRCASSCPAQRSTVLRCGPVVCVVLDRMARAAAL